MPTLPDGPSPSNGGGGGGMRQRAGKARRGAGSGEVAGQGGGLLLPMGDDDAEADLNHLAGLPRHDLNLM